MSMALAGMPGRGLFFRFEKANPNTYNHGLGCGEKAMNTALSDAHTKELMTEVLVEMIEQKREVFYEIIVEALEDIGLARAIVEGRKSEFVNKAEIRELLKG